MVYLLSILIASILHGNIESQVQKNLDIYAREIENVSLKAEYSWAYISTIQTLCDKPLILKNVRAPQTLIDIGLTTNFICGNLDDKTSIYKRIASNFSDFQHQIAYLSLESDSLTRDQYILDLLSDKNDFTDKQAELLSILRSKSNFSSYNLPFELDPYLHFSLINSNHYRKKYTDNYYSSAINNWISQNENNSKQSDLIRDIQLSSIILASFRNNRYAVILKHYEKFVESTIFPFGPERLTILRAIDYSLYDTGNSSSSLNIIRNHFLPLAEYLNQEESILNSKKALAGNLYALGKYEESNKIYHELESSSSSVVDKISLYTNLSVNYLKLGNNNLYIEYQLLALNEPTPARYQNILTIYRNLFLFYSRRNNYNLAQPYIEKAKQIAEEKKDTLELAKIYTFQGSQYWEQNKDLDLSISYLNQAEEVLSNKSYIFYSDILKQKGEIYLEVDSLKLAKNNFEILRSTATEASNNIAYTEALIYLTQIAIAERELSQAKVYIEELNIYDNTNLDFIFLVRKLTNEAHYSYLTGSKRPALTKLSGSFDQVISWVQNSADPQTGGWANVQEYLDYFTLLMQMLIETEEYEIALKYLDRIKSINDVVLSNSPLLKADKLSEEDLILERRLSEQIEQLRSRYLAASSDEQLTINSEISRLSAQKDRLLEQVVSDNSYQLPPLWNIRRNLEDNTAILHFTELDDNLYKTIVSSEGISINILEGSDSGLFSLINNAADDLNTGKPDLFKLKALSDKLSLRELSDYGKLVIIPDNNLYRIPIDALPVTVPTSSDSYGSTRYLIEDHQIEYFTSLSEYMNNKRDTDRIFEDDFSVFAISDFKNIRSADLPSLPFATIEAEQIRFTLNELASKNMYLQEDATKATFKSKISSSRVVHVATHSEVSEQDPLFSTIYFNEKSEVPAGSDEQSEILYAYELFNTSLNTELIMLNSCSSGSGNYMQGTGIMGIARALRYAGAKSLALNLWSVNDMKASNFAVDFYYYINQGISKSESMRMAKLKQLKSGNANPHYWGAYMLIGNPSPVTNNASKDYTFFAVITLLMMVTGYVTRQQSS